MKIAFEKLHANFEFNESLQNEEVSVVFSGVISHKSAQLFTLKATLKGSVKHQCDRCCEDLSVEFSQELELLVSNGASEEADYEFFDSCVDLASIIQSETQLFNSDYFYCQNCKNNDNFEFILNEE